MLTARTETAKYLPSLLGRCTTWIRLSILWLVALSTAVTIRSAKSCTGGMGRYHQLYYTVVYMGLSIGPIQRSDLLSSSETFRFWVAKYLREGLEMNSTYHSVRAYGTVGTWPPTPIALNVRSQGYLLTFSSSFSHSSSVVAALKLSSS